MTLTELHARRQRLWFNGKRSSELEVVASPRWRRKRRDDLGLFLIHRQEPLCDADLEKLIPTVHNYPKNVCEPAVLDPDEAPPITLRQIVRTVAEFYGVSVLDVVSARRDAKVMRPRQVTYYLCKKLTTRGFPAIGRAIGRRDHTTPMSGVKKMERLIPVDRELADEIEHLKDVLRGAASFPVAVPIDG